MTNNTVFAWTSCTAASLTQAWQTRSWGFCTGLTLQRLTYQQLLGKPKKAPIIAACGTEEKIMVDHDLFISGLLHGKSTMMCWLVYIPSIHVQLWLWCFFHLSLVESSPGWGGGEGRDKSASEQAVNGWAREMRGGGRAHCHHLVSCLVITFQSQPWGGLCQSKSYTYNSEHELLGCIVSPGT